MVLPAKDAKPPPPPPPMSLASHGRTNPVGSSFAFKCPTMETDIVSVSKSSEAPISGAIAIACLEARVRKRRSRQKNIAFLSAMTNCLCAGSILLFSLYAPCFQKNLGYNQMQVNAVAIAGELGVYLPVPIFGSICDRSGPHTLSILSAMFYGSGYLLASYVVANNLPFWAMIIAWTLVGAGSSSMYFSGVTTCAKNFTGNSRGIALALPIAAFGLSSFWETQVIGRLFVGENGDLNVAEAFRALSGALMVIGFSGGLGLSVVPNDEAERPRKGDLEYACGERSTLLSGNEDGRTDYGGVHAPTYSGEGGTLAKAPVKNGSWLSEATVAFLKDRTMWWFAGGVFFVTGSGEAFINNMGTIIQAIYTPNTFSARAEPVILAPNNQISVATHVSVVALTSTISRLFAGSLSDYLAPAVPVEPPASEPAEVMCQPLSECKPKRFVLSRMYLLLSFAIIMLFGQLFLASGMVDNRGELFWVVSASIGAGYGAAFTLAPTVVSIVWGVENFGTNWGIVTMTPAVGATLYGLIFAKGYDDAAERHHYRSYPRSLFGSLSYANYNVPAASSILVSESPGDNTAKARLCYGKECYDRAFYIMSASVALACVLWVYAWRGPSRISWIKRGAVV